MDVVCLLVLLAVFVQRSPMVVLRVVGQARGVNPIPDQAIGGGTALGFRS